MLFLICALLFIYYYLTRTYGYWKKRNVKHDTPVPLFGNNFKNYIGKVSWTETSIKLYNKYPNEKVVGYYRGMNPELLIRDLNIVKHILNIDFPYFYPRGLGRDNSVEPLFMNLFHADGDTWKLMRQRLTPVFTSGKLKAMFPLIIKCAQKLQNLTENIASNENEYDVRELMARFTTEFIGVCGFGIEMETLDNEQSLFRKLGREIFNVSLPDMIVIAIKDLFPTLTKQWKPDNNNVEAMIMEILNKIREQRNYKPSGRNDFIDLLLELESQGKIKGESIEKRNDDGTPITVEMEMDLNMMAAQLFVFFAAGFETSSSATSFTLHQLAYNPDIQSKIHEEIDLVLSKHNNTLSYDAIKEMDLLGRSFKEALRMFPSLGVLNRDCASKYKIPNSDIIIDPRVKIVIPIMAIQNDDAYFENPKKFDPDRFLEENFKEKNKYSYLPFGEGPRTCIGSRMGQMQSLAGLAAVLQKFRVEPSKSTIRHPEIMHRSNVVQSIKGGLPLRIIKRESTLTGHST